MATAMAADAGIRCRILDPIPQDPGVDALAINVTVDRGRVILTGTAETFIPRRAAELAALRATAVQAVANHVQVRPRAGGSHPLPRATTAPAAARSPGRPRPPVRGA